MTPSELVRPHFLRLMHNGKHRGSSYSEKGCLSLAREIRKYVVSLDATAVLGLHEWIDFCKQYPTTAQDMLETSPGAKATIQWYRETEPAHA